ncbi:MAG: ABC transporter substrate-binding protein [Nonomuraea sp.]|nr:ABC transporter substrate-binding protein [Nonomuraea sp.]
MSRLPLVVLGLALAATACAPSSGGSTVAQVRPSATIEQGFDLDKLIAAAKAEGSVLVYDGSGDVVEVAKAFSAKYGIKAEGVKSKATPTAEKMTREAQAGNVTIDVALFEDGPMLVGQLLPQKVVSTWIPPDLAGSIDPANRDPLMMISKAYVFTYNPKLNPGGCPAKTLWDLTGPQFKGKLMMQDPLGKEVFPQWWTQMAAHGADKMAKSGAQDPVRDWVKAVAKNAPVLTGEDEDVAAAVGAPDQTRTVLGLMSISKFRDIEEKGYHLAVCDLTPWSGFQYPKFAVVATGSKHPNAAKLFVHFVMEKQGFDLESGDGGISGNKTVGASPNNPPGLTDWSRQLFVFDSTTLLDDFRKRQEMKDFWRLEHSG